jgi:NAD(P)-dependent dehydrogenase (short-subunit alcohol dehydrogenase family)
LQAGAKPCWPDQNQKFAVFALAVFWHPSCRLSLIFSKECVPLTSQQGEVKGWRTPVSNPFYEDLFSVKGKVALITGGTRGIGLMIAEGLLRCGARVYISSRKPDVCAEAEAALSKFGTCAAIPGDVSSVEGCKALADELGRREAHVDILVNNAGTTWSLPIDEFHEKAWNKVVDLDMKGPFFLTQALLPLLRAAASDVSPASVINISSINGLRPSNLQNYSYVAAKAGLAQLSVQMAADLVPENINVNVIAPGLFESKMTAPLFANEEIKKAMLAGIPMGRSGSLENISGLVAFLSSTAGNFLSGAIIACDGGASTLA